MDTPRRKVKTAKLTRSNLPLKKDKGASLGVEPFKDELSHISRRSSAPFIQMYTRSADATTGDVGGMAKPDFMKIYMDPTDEREFERFARKANASLEEPISEDELYSMFVVDSTVKYLKNKDVEPVHRGGPVSSYKSTTVEETEDEAGNTDLANIEVIFVLMGYTEKEKNEVFEKLNHLGVLNENYDPSVRLRKLAGLITENYALEADGEYRSPTIDIAYEVVSPESAAEGDVEERGIYEADIDMAPEVKDEIAYSEALVDKTIKFIEDFKKRSGGDLIEPSSSQFHEGVWYTIYNLDYKEGKEMSYSIHLNGYNTEEQKRIYDSVKGFHKPFGLMEFKQLVIKTIKEEYQKVNKVK
jgi:hypothetical protein